jgi:hypothetical protein
VGRVLAELDQNRVTHADRVAGAVALGAAFLWLFFDTLSRAHPRAEVRAHARRAMLAMFVPLYGALFFLACRALRQ